AIVGLSIEISSHQQILENAQQQFEKLGAVNLAASEEYEEVSKRFLETTVARGEAMEQVWRSTFDDYSEKYPELAEQYAKAFENETPELTLTKHEMETSKASRVTSQEAIQELSAQMPNLWGGSADLSASNNTMVKVEEDFMPDNYAGRNIWFGVREFAMGAIMNGIALHGGTRVYGGTFFV
ncbi:MAG: hypothetical protein RR588_17100, partial [Solibacillus sp.]